jgi:TRAP-type mannitol/chloroaromatic compound transport system permease small subunit
VSKITHAAQSFMGRVEMVSDRFHTALGWMSCILLFLMMFYIVSDVTGRYLFLQPMPGTIMLTQSVLVFAVFLSLAHVLIRKEHVRVMIVHERLPSQLRFSLDILAFTIGFFVMLIVAWRTLPSAIYAFQHLEYGYGETGLTFPLPTYPAKFAVFFGSALLCIQFFIELLRLIFGGPADETPAAATEER